MYNLAIYGGTFAPVHNGHVRACKAFYDFIKPDKLLLIPTLIPPHKQIDFDDNPYDRLEMLKLAFRTDPNYEKSIFVSDFELESPPPSYTYNTLKHFYSPDVKITFLCGTDMFLTLDKWYKPAEIFKMCRIALMLRHSTERETDALIDQKRKEFISRFNADIIIIRNDPVDISSSEIRNGSDELRKKFLPSAVYDYIKEHSLYVK